MNDRKGKHRGRQAARRFLAVSFVKSSVMVAFRSRFCRLRSLPRATGWIAFCLYCNVPYDSQRGELMASRSVKRSSKSLTASPLMVRLDSQSKTLLAAAAELRQVSLSDYVRTVTVAQAQREVRAARDRTIAMTADEQLAFWNALNEPVKLTPAQRRLGAILRGES